MSTVSAKNHSTTWQGKHKEDDSNKVTSYCLYENIDNVIDIKQLMKLPAKKIRQHLKIIKLYHTIETLSRHWEVGEELVHRIYNISHIEPPSDK